MRLPRSVCGLFALLATPVVLAGSQVWVIGGGSTPSNSQAQIELNVKWSIDVLRQDHRRLHVYYTGGPDARQDVRSWTRPEESKTSLQPLARVFGDQEANGDRYYDHTIPVVKGSTVAASLQQQLATDFATLKPGDRATIVYNGHGLRDKTDPSRNTLQLWNDTQLSVRDLDELLTRIPATVPVRFVFTQCYSGGFARLIRPKTRDVATLGTGLRCGFMAEAEDKEAEGCAATIEIGDYRDYTTYFFSALHGKTRTGGPIASNPDYDGNGVVTPFEAHLYVLQEAHNADLPRSTSEVYLERWEPWYLRWFDTGAEPANVYSHLAQAVARKQTLPASGRDLIRALQERRQTHETRFIALQREKDKLETEVPRIQKSIQHDLIGRWPQAGHPYTLNFQTFLRRDVTAAQDYILAHARYPELVTKQDRYATLVTELVTVDRQITQLDKIVRLRRLARLLAAFERHATATEHANYTRLRSCEELPL